MTKQIEIIMIKLRVRTDISICRFGPPQDKRKAENKTVSTQHEQVSSTENGKDAVVSVTCQLYHILQRFNNLGPGSSKPD